MLEYLDFASCLWKKVPRHVAKISVTCDFNLFYASRSVYSL